MRILHICEYNEPVGGTEQYILSLSSHLECLGHFVSVIYGKQKKAILSNPKRPSYFLPEVAQLHNSISTATEKALDDIFVRDNPDVVYLHNISNYAIVRKALKAKPVVRYIHDHRLCCPQGNKLFASGNKICNRPLGLGCFFCWATANLCLRGFGLKRIQNTFNAIELYKNLRLIVASDFMRKCLQQNELQVSNINVVPYFCNFEKPAQASIGNTILFVGQLEKHKGVQYLIKSMRMLPESLRLIIIGTGHYEKKLKLMAKRMHMEKRIDFLGFLSNAELQEYYNKCLCLVVPSAWGEPFGIIGLEAMFCSKPVIAFNVGGISEWLKDKETGFLVEQKNINELGGRINYLFNNKQQVLSLGLSGQKSYFSRFTLDAHVTALLKIFNEEISRYGLSQKC